MVRRPRPQALPVRETLAEEPTLRAGAVAPAVVVPGAQALTAHGMPVVPEVQVSPFRGPGYPQSLLRVVVVVPATLAAPEEALDPPGLVRVGTTPLSRVEQMPTPARVVVAVAVML